MENADRRICKTSICNRKITHKKRCSNKRNAIVVLKCANFRFLLLFTISNWLHKFNYWSFSLALLVFFFNFSSRALYTVNRPRAWRAKRIYCSLIPLEFDCVRATFGPVIHVDDFNFSTEIHNRTKKQTSKIRVPFFIPSLSRSRFSTNECTFFLGVCVCVCLSNLCGDIYSSVNR